MSEGSFFVKANNDGCFQLKQRIHIQLFESFKLLFETNRKISVENNLETPSSCKPDGPFKTNLLENIYFHIPSHIKVRCLGIDLKIPTINAPGLEINSLISCWIDLPINYHEILYLSVIKGTGTIPCL